MKTLHDFIAERQEVLLALEEANVKKEFTVPMNKEFENDKGDQFKIVAVYFKYNPVRKRMMVFGDIWYKMFETGKKGTMTHQNIDEFASKNL